MPETSFLSFFTYEGQKVGYVKKWVDPLFPNFLAQNSEKTQFYTSLNKPQLDFNIHYFQWNCRWTSLVYTLNNHNRQHNGLFITFIALLSHLKFLDFLAFFYVDSPYLHIPGITNFGDFISGRRIHENNIHPIQNIYIYTSRRHVCYGFTFH